MGRGRVSKIDVDSLGRVWRYLDLGEGEKSHVPEVLLAEYTSQRELKVLWGLLRFLHVSFLNVFLML